MSIFNNDVTWEGPHVHIETTLLQGFPGVRDRYIDAQTVMGPMQQMDTRFYPLGMMIPGDFNFGCLVVGATGTIDW